MLYAPGLTRIEDIRRVVAEVWRPVNVLAYPGAPDGERAGSGGRRRVSVGGAFAFAGIDAVARAARELRDEGTYGYLDDAAAGSALARQAFGGDGE